MIDLTEQNKPKNSHGQPTRLYVYCTVRAIWQWISRSTKTFPNPNSKFHTFPGPGIKFSKFRNFSKISKPVRTLYYMLDSVSSHVPISSHSPYKQSPSHKSPIRSHTATSREIPYKQSHDPHKQSRSQESSISRTVHLCGFHVDLSTLSTMSVVFWRFFFDLSRESSPWFWEMFFTWGKANQRSLCESLLVGPDLFPNCLDLCQTPAGLQGLGFVQSSRSNFNPRRAWRNPMCVREFYDRQ